MYIIKRLCFLQGLSMLTAVTFTGAIFYLDFAQVKKYNIEKKYKELTSWEIVQVGKQVAESLGQTTPSDAEKEAAFFKKLIATLYLCMVVSMGVPLFN